MKRTLCIIALLCCFQILVAVAIASCVNFVKIESREAWGNCSNGTSFACVFGVGTWTCSGPAGDGIWDFSLDAAARKACGCD